ncbi:hypothetical protein BRADI_2g07975v3 [Brachypodium distachyon]|uniref:Uncharacterized protein n=1 Tax=Brachypodium distachyon TaxID=15368 RepID=A0A0Q3QPR6_BRADI|nr:hypothetical protein BRADI_2g07975v3 [Brachypodium distachyon]
MDLGSDTAHAEQQHSSKTASTSGNSSNKTAAGGGRGLLSSIGTCKRSSPARKSTTVKFDGRRTWRRQRRFCGLRERRDESWGSPRACRHSESNGGSGSSRGRWRRWGVVELTAVTGSFVAGPARAAWARGEGGDGIPGARRSFRCRVCAGEVTGRGSAGGALCRRRGRRCGADGAGTEEEEARPGGARGSRGRSGSWAAREERRRRR